MLSVFGILKVMLLTEIQKILAMYIFVLLNIYLPKWLIIVILIHEIFLGIGETEGETSVNKTTEVSCQTSIAERRS